MRRKGSMGKGMERGSVTGWTGKMRGKAV